MKRFVPGLAILFALAGNSLVTGCRSATDLTASALPIVFFEGQLTGQLVLASEDGTRRRMLLDLPDAFAQYPRWSRNGHRIVFWRNSEDPHGPGGLYMINADGSALTAISTSGVSAGAADWSPDDSHLVVYSGTGIALIGTDGSGLSPFPVTNADPRYGTWGLSWSPDGNEILYNGSHNVGGFQGGPDVWVFNISAGTSRMIATPALDARWSPDGQRIAYIGSDALGVPASLNVVDRDASNPRTLIPTGAAGPNWPEFTWSPDGKWLLYVGWGCCSNDAIHRISVDGGASSLVSGAPDKSSRYPDWRWAP
jgi:Tol biopolymer transport system component